MHLEIRGMSEFGKNSQDNVIIIRAISMSQQYDFDFPLVTKNCTVSSKCPFNEGSEGPFADHRKCGTHVTIKSSLQAEILRK